MCAAVCTSTCIEKSEGILEYDCSGVIYLELFYFILRQVLISLEPTGLARLAS